ncbi:MAG: hypothetical protein U5R30_11090 [Deltaproteobacteria bacterium]|nr:hypothetical protein [Deltaproteobacteria bacterium]
MLQLVSQVQARVTALEKYETGKRDLVLNSLKCDLLCTRDRHSLIRILCRHLPVIGIHSAALVIHVDEEYSRFFGGFLHSGELPEDGEPFPFPASSACSFHARIPQGCIPDPAPVHGKPVPGLCDLQCSLPYRYGI